MPSTSRLLACAVLSSAMLYASFFPISFGWLAWLAFVPWLSLAACERHPRLYLIAWLGGAIVAFCSLSWVPVADRMMTFAWLILGTYYSLHFPLALYLVRLLWRRLGIAFTFSFPLVWVALEYARTNFAGGFWTMLTGSHQHDVPGGFAWYLLGHTQHDFLEAIQVADLGGAFAVSLVVALVNGLLYEAVWARWERPRFSRKALLAQALLVCVIVGGTLAYGVRQLRHPPGETGPRIALLQGSIDQRMLNDAWFEDKGNREKAREKQAHAYHELCRLAMGHKPALIIGPETSYPGPWVNILPGKMHAETREMADALVKSFKTHHLLGMNVGEFGPDLLRRPDEYNSAILISPGDPRVLARYDKIHRVPFGEYVPLRAWLPFLRWFIPYEADYGVSPGKEFTRFSINGATFGVLICYEDTVPAIARAHAGADFLVNISNDGWFDGTSEHDQHLAISRFRAVETRRPLVRAVNMGISAVIDADGRVLTPTQTDAGSGVWVVKAGERRSMPPAEWGRFKKSSCVIIADVPLDGRQSVYARIGDVLAMTVCAVLGLLLVASRWSNPRGNEEHDAGRPVVA